MRISNVCQFSQSCRVICVCVHCAKCAVLLASLPFVPCLGCLEHVPIVPIVPKDAAPPLSFRTCHLDTYLRTCYGRQRHHASGAQTILTLAQVALENALQTTTALASVPIVPIVPCPWRLCPLCQLCRALSVFANCVVSLASGTCANSANCAVPLCICQLFWP